MTPERIKAWQQGLTTNEWADRDVVIDLASGLTMTAGELRWLLNAATQAGKTCEWKLRDNGRTAVTHCGAHVDLCSQSIGNRPCWCGGKVVVK